MSSVHEPVLGIQVIQWLAPKSRGVYADGTLGGCGHTKLIAESVAGQAGSEKSDDEGPNPDSIDEVSPSLTQSANVPPSCRIIGLDRDPSAIEAAPEHWRGAAITAVHASYSELSRVARDLEIDGFDGILLDLGLSSDQLSDSSRGFSFDAEGDLDLRFDPTSGQPAWKLISRLSEKHLADMIYEFGEEKLSRRIARDIVEHRRNSPIRTADQLANIVRRSVSKARASHGSRHESIDPATRTFQALRIAVNEELSILKQALHSLPDLLKPGGRLAIISFHSLEDRLVKHSFRNDERLTVLTRKPIRPDDSEIERNRRSRSSRLRVAERAAR